MVIKIQNRPIGEGQPVFIIAELSANHLQNKDLAIKTIKAMKDAGADAVKLQTYTPDTITIDSDQEYFRIKQGTLWDDKTYYQLYAEAYTPWEWHKKLSELADELGLIFFSSPFDLTSVDFLEELDVPAYKIASFEITDIPLIEYIASKGKPVIISTGIATLSDIEEALNACHRMGNEQVILLKCTSAYPSPLDDLNLNVIPNLKETFGVTVGLSDHTLERCVPITAVALGAKVIEKHFILDRSLGGPDASFSLEPNDFRSMVDDIRKTETALGTVNYDLTDKMKHSRCFSRSLFVVEDIKCGEKLSEKNIKSIRPGLGLHPRYLKNVLGRTVRKDVIKGTPLNWDLIN